MKAIYNRTSRFIWKCCSEREEGNDESLLTEKILSLFFHLAGIHEWGPGKFVDLFNFRIKKHVFPPGAVHDVFFSRYLCCDHLNHEENVVDAESAEYGLILADLTSNNRLISLQRAARIISTSVLESYHSVVLQYRPKRYHLYVVLKKNFFLNFITFKIFFSWYFDTRNMLAVLHHNGNIHAENRGDRQLLSATFRIGRANDQPNPRMCKTIMLDWQKELINIIKQQKILVNFVYLLSKNFLNLNLKIFKILYFLVPY